MVLGYYTPKLFYKCLIVNLFCIVLLCNSSIFAKTKVNNMAIHIETISRTIYYYELNFAFTKDFKPSDGNQFRELFNIIWNIARAKESIRYQIFGEKSIFIQDVVIEPTTKTITGKLRSIRKDLLPEIMNTTTDEARGIDAKEEEGLVETTHFLINYSSKNNKKLAIEYNQFGARIADFVMYLQSVGTAKNVLTTVGYRPIVRDELGKFIERINRCSDFVVKIHKDNLAQIQEFDGQLFSAIESSIDQFKSEFATLDLKFDYRKKQATNEISSFLKNIIRKLVADRSKVDLFNVLKVTAEDSDKNNRLAVFDLLVDKVRSNIKVQKKERYRTVISDDIFDKMKTEFIRKNI